MKNPDPYTRHCSFCSKAYDLHTAEVVERRSPNTFTVQQVGLGADDLALKCPHCGFIPWNDFPGEAD